MFKFILVIFFFSFASLHSDNPGDKLFRGLGNVLSGWLEIPLTIYSESYEKNVIIGFTFGAVKGVFHGALRTLAGAYEVGTFLFPIPPDYQAIIHPELVFDKDI